MDEPNDKLEQEKKPNSGESQQAEKPKKQPRVWVKPGTTATADDSTPQGARAGATAPKPSDQKGAAEAAPKTATPVPPKRPAKEETPTYLDISQDPLVLRIRQFLPDVVPAAQSFLNQKILTIDTPFILSVCEFLKEDPESDYDLLEDLTAVDYPEREKRFVVVYQLYSLRRNVQLRLKCNVAADEEISSVTSVWSAANWLEREVYDMFGIVFTGHPDLKRILLPEDWVGHPLRKDYDLRKQDEDWIRRHLQIRK